MQGTDYYFYGTTNLGGKYGLGCIFRVSSSGDFKVLFNFDGTHGANPEAGLIQASDGNFYGVTFSGGSKGLGVVFKMAPTTHAVTVLHNFKGGEGGGEPVGGLVQASDGNLYGTTGAYGGSSSDGVLFRISLAGSFTVLHHFTGLADDGANPVSALMQHTNGVLYGMTYYGGSADEGTFFSTDAGLKPFATFLPVYGRAGAVVEILGQGFTAESTVAFNGVRARCTEIYPTYMKAIVPLGATSGPITVTTANGILASNKVFVIHPE